MSYRRAWTPPDRTGGPMSSTCPDCGKQRYMTRKDARKAANRVSRRRRSYRCGAFWHNTSQDAATTAQFREKGHRR